MAEHRVHRPRGSRPRPFGAGASVRHEPTRVSQSHAETPRLQLARYMFGCMPMRRCYAVHVACACACACTAPHARAMLHAKSRSSLRRRFGAGAASAELELLLACQETNHLLFRRWRDRASDAVASHSAAIMPCSWFLQETACSASGPRRRSSVSTPADATAGCAGSLCLRRLAAARRCRSRAALCAAAAVLG